MTEKRQEKESTISPWRVRDYRSWFVADTASALGTTIGGFAFTLVAYAVSHDVTTAGMVGTVFALCEGLGTLPGGHLSDRIDRKKLMIVFGLISAATLCVMTLALVAKMMSAPLLFLFAIVRGLTSGVFSNVSNIILPQIVTGNQLVQAYSANESRDACIQLFSKPLSGFLYGLGPEIPFLISAVLYALMSVATPLIRSDLRPKNDASPSDSDDSTKKTPRNHIDGSSSHSSLIEGFAWYTRWPQAVSVFGSVLLLNCVLTLMVSIVILNQQMLNIPGWQIGLISTGSGVGLLSGSFLTTPLANRLTGGRTVQVSFIIIMVGCALQPLTQNTYLLAGCMAIMNLMVVPANSVLGAYASLIIPNDLRGRVFSVFSLFNITLASLASGIAGIMLSSLGYMIAAATTAAIMTGTVLLAFMSNGIREIPDKAAFSNLEPWR